MNQTNFKTQYKKVFFLKDLNKKDCRIVINLIK